jgi:hypothetical protein
MSTASPLRLDIEKVPRVNATRAGGLDLARTQVSE